MGTCGWDMGGSASAGLLQFWTTRESTRAWPRLGATVRTSFSSMTANILVESNPCCITEEIVLSERPSFLSRAKNSGSTAFLGSTCKGICGTVGGGGGTEAGSGVPGGGGTEAMAACTGPGAEEATAAAGTGAGGAGSGGGIERLGSGTGIEG